ncbi:MAG TPA: PAS domain S-box protein [Candidatus Competibacteraceae bacterium]|nr:PAS domain S-box protein [Candidatus Competibacteraceae bacterium]
MTETGTTPSIPPTLLSVTWPFVAGFLAIMTVGVFSLEILMAARSFSYGENLWAKNQKSATFQLLRYAQTGDPLALQRHDTAMDIHQHFRKGHAAAIGTPYRSAIVLEEFGKAGIAPADIEKAAWLHQTFRHTEMVRKIFSLWSEGEAVMARLEPLRAELAAYYRQNRDDSRRLAEIAAEIDEIDRSLEPKEFEFSLMLGAMAHRVYGLLLAVEVLLGSVLLVAIVWRTFRLLQERHRIEQTLAAERQWATVTLASIGEAVVSTDRRGRVIYMNPAAERLIQRSVPETGAVVQHPPLTEMIRLIERETGIERALLTDELLDGRIAGLHSEIDHLLVRSDGTSVPVSWVASPVRDDSETRGVVLALHDTTREQQLINRLSWLAAYDPLTGLPNRREFEARLSQALATLRQRDGPGGLRREDSQQHVLMLIDLDQFKIINDTCGHAAGDDMLQQVTDVMSRHLRDQDTLARMGGDEFGLLLINCPPENGEQKAEELRRAVSQIMLTWGLRRFTISASIGLIHLDRPHSDLGAVMSAADMACYKAKDNGRNRVEVYRDDDEHLAARFGEMAWAQRLQTALKENRFCLYAQPILGLQGGADAGERCELLIRLRDEDGKLIPPGSFIPAAERFGMMTLIDRWVIDCALGDIARRLAAGSSDRHAVFSINLSGSSFGDKQFLAEIKSLFERYRVPHRHVCFEITETQAVTHLAQAIGFINELRALGCSFALDDFGAGMSSFAYLKHIPVDYLKIDGKLVEDMIDDPVARAMVEMINRLGHTMNIKTAGEYAATQEIVDALRKSGVDYAQGFAVDHPQPWSSE